MTTMLLVIAGLFGFTGLAQLSEAMQGIGLIAFACWLAILGRVFETRNRSLREADTAVGRG